MVGPHVCDTLGATRDSERPSKRGRTWTDWAVQAGLLLHVVPERG
ncbi:hypothetical protein GALL_322100 [mine drainage metagenome]|uniref:Uncharacterized protein n=1 Tax=mine drainage metagenome TaxID=410659 RepID=A0A1J5QQN2_9ZZZZ